MNAFKDANETCIAPRDILYCGRSESWNLDDKILSSGGCVEIDADLSKVSEIERGCQSSKDVGTNSNFQTDRSMPVVISFYTVNTPYEQEVMRLINSCERLDLEHCIEGRESKRSWEENCGVKPFYILEKLNQLKRPILWVDADGAFLKMPSFDQFASFDFSVRIVDFLPKSHREKVISNTVFVNYTPQGLSIVERWGKSFQRKLKNDPKIWDQEVLRDIVLKEKNAKILPMPLAYSKIYDLDAHRIEQEKVIIEHYQASRLFKNFI